MGLYDYYIPAGPYPCPMCESKLDGWQGRDSDCLLLVWQQGIAHPIDQKMDDDIKCSPDELKKFVLPNRFEMYDVCGCFRFIILVGYAINGVWNKTEYLTDNNAVPYSHENESDFISRKRNLSSHPGYVGG